jgi:hypothetical protein
MKDILYDGKVSLTPMASELIAKINAYSQQPTAQAPTAPPPNTQAPTAAQ